MKNTSHHRWLAQQLPKWISEGLITQQQAETLSQRHPDQASVLNGRMLINTAAAIMVGLGVIALFAFNWEAMHRGVKLALIFSVFAGAHIIGLRSAHTHPVRSETAHALGTMFMGAAIFLVSQIYHLSEHYPNAFILWSLGALALAWAKPSLTQAILALILISVWHLMEVLDFNFANPTAFPLILLGILPLVFRFQSPWLARLTSIALLVSMSMTVAWLDNDLSLYALLFMTAALIYTTDLLHNTNRHELHDIGHELGRAPETVFLVMLFLFSFSEFLHEFDQVHSDNLLANSYVAMTFIASQALFIYNLIKGQLSELAKLVELSIVLLLIALFYEASMVIAIVFNLIILAVSIMMMLRGSREGVRKQAVRGALLFAALVIMRFMDLFDDLVLRGLAFVAMGIFLFWISRRSEKNSGEKAA